MTTKEEISKWIQDGKKQLATHMIVVCDTFDWSDYPVYVKKGEDVRAIEQKYTGNMQKIMEVYNLNVCVDKQLNQERSFNYENDDVE